MVAMMETIVCACCGKDKPHSDFSKTQRKKKAVGARCKLCIEEQAAENSVPTSSATTAVTLTPIEIKARPQRPVPGFDDTTAATTLTCCSDWPLTKNGRPPSAQSAIFMPLLAGVLGGPIENHCTEQQVQFAMQWWTEVFPAWPTWIEKLRQAGVVNERRHSLLGAAKGQPNPLIPKAKGRGTVPHIPGKLQTECIESDMDVAVQLYQCIQCLYSPP